MHYARRMCMCICVLLLLRSLQQCLLLLVPPAKE